MTPGLLAAHHEQALSNSCLAACIAMVRLRLGELPPHEASAHELSLMQRLCASPKGLIPEVAASELGSSLIKADPDDPNNLIVLRAGFASQRWWFIATLYPAPLNHRRLRQDPPPTSRHGALSEPGPHHAVVLTSFADDSFLYLDPWYPAAFQPQSLPFAEFGRAWTGWHIPVRLA